MAALATWFTPVLSVLSRSDGKSAVAAAAYRTCTKLHDELYEKVHDYTRKGGHVISKIFGDHNFTIEELWNAAEAADTRKNSRTARELMVPLPFDWTDEQREAYCDALIKMLNESYGVAGVYSIHKPHDGRNYHVHILFTTREVVNGEFLKKTRVLDEGKKNGEIKKLRDRVAEITNAHSEINGSDFYVTGGLFAEHIENHIPTLNIPINASPKQRAALESDNEEIKKTRSQLAKMESEYVSIQKAISDLKSAEINIEVPPLENTPSVEAKKKPIERIIEPVVPTTQVVNGVPDWVATSSPFDSPKPHKPSAKKVEDAKADVGPSQLSISLDYRNTYQEVQRAHTKRKEVRDIARAWIKELKELEAEPPSQGARLLATVVRSLGLKDTVTAYEEKVAKAYDQLAKCKKHDESLTSFINDPERKRKYQEWQQWPEHRQRVKEYELTLPDAKRPKPKPLANNGQPRNVVNLQQNDYSWHPYYISDEPKPFE